MRSPSDRRGGALTLTLAMLLAAGVAWPPQRSAAGEGFSALYAGESAFPTLQQGEVGVLTVFFENIGNLAWVRGSATQVDLAACREDKIRCDAQDPRESPFNAGWLSPTRYSTHAQPSVLPGAIATFTYTVRVPVTASAGTYRFNGDLVVSRTGELISPQGYFHDILVQPRSVTSITRREAMSMPAGSLALTREFPSVTYTGPNGAVDASIAAGPDSVIVGTTEGLRIHAKDGALVASSGPSDLFRPLLEAGTGTADPRVQFDPESGRFFIVGAQAPAIRGCIPGTCRNKWTIAVSKSSMPRSFGLADWHLYAFDGTLEDGRPTNYWADFGTVGMNSTTLIFTGSGDRDHDTPQAGPQYAKIFVLDKPALVRGEPVRAPLADFHGDTPEQRMIKVLAATTFGDPPTVFAVEAARSELCPVTIVGISGAPTAPTFTRRTAPASGSCGYPPGAPQLGGGALLDVGLLMSSQPVYRDGYIWLVQPVSVSFASGASSGIRLVQVDVRKWPETPQVVFDSTFAEEGVWYMYPAVAVSATHDVAIVMLRTSAREYASVYYTGRFATDPPTAFRTPVPLKLGTANQRRAPVTSGDRVFQRLADFSGAALDPVDGTAWLVGEYVDGSCSWGTWVANVDWAIVGTTSGTLPSLPPPGLTTPAC